MNSKSTFLKRLGIFTGCCLAGLVLAACSGGDSAAPEGETTLERIQRTGTIRIGYANEAPYAYQDTSTGRVTGEAPEIARVIAADLGVTEVEGVLTEFGSLIPGLRAGRYDVIAAGMYILPKRCEQVNFSNPTYSIGEAMAVASGNPHGIDSYSSFVENDTLTLGVVNGTVEIGYAESIGIPDEQIVNFPDAPSAVAGLRAGRVDAYAGTALTVQDLVDKDSSGRVERAAPFEQPVVDGESVRGYGAFAFSPEDDDLREFFNEKIAAYIGSPEHQEMVRPFGFTKDELPMGKTAAELCAAGE